MSIYRKQTSTYKTFMGMKNLTIDLCKYLGGSGISSAVIDILFPKIKEHSNAFHPCPFSVGVCCNRIKKILIITMFFFLLFYQGNLYAKNLTMDDDDYPPIFSTGSYLIQFMAFTKDNRSETSLFKANLSLRLIPKSFYV